MTERALPPPFTLVALEETDSTNDDVKRRAAAGAGHGLVVTAERQSMGRGRSGRVWDSPAGNLHCSILLDCDLPPTRAPELAFVAAVALYEALAALLPAAAFRLKWPNDVLCAGAKLAGMLLESIPPRVVLGVGVDVASAPQTALYPATCLHRQGSGAQPFDVLAGFCGQLGLWYDRWREAGFAPVRKAWLGYADAIGRPLTVRPAAEQSVEGRFAGIDERGALLLDLSDGRRLVLLAGDVLLG